MSKKVLIIEDDRWLSDTFEKVLQKNGWQTQVASDGEKGIDAIDDFTPDVLLLDFILPGPSASALLNELQSHTDLAGLPVVLCTSLDMKDFDADSLKRYGVRAVLDKTNVQPSEIVEALNCAAA